MHLHLRITINSQRAEISLNRGFDPERWNQKTGRAIGTKEDARSLNAYLETMQVKIYEFHRELVAAGEDVSIQKIKNKLLGKEDQKARMLLEIFAQHNKDMTVLIQTEEYAQGTLTHFETTYKHVQNFLQWKYNLKDIAIDKVDYSFINDFEFYLNSQYFGLYRQE
jgi:hypothetical protein